MRGGQGVEWDVCFDAELAGAFIHSICLCLATAAHLLSAHPHTYTRLQPARRHRCRHRRRRHHRDLS